MVCQVSTHDSLRRGRLKLLDARVALLIYAGMAFYYVVEPLMAARQKVGSL